MKITLRQLLYFDALARERHFGRAANRVAVTQPAMSAQIRDLEALIGAPLVDRAPGGLSLTPLGREVERRAQLVLREAAEIEGLGSTSETPIRLGMIPTLAPYLVPEFLAKAAAQGAVVSVSEGLTARLLDQVRAGDLDAAVVALPSSDAALIEHFLFEERFLLAVPESDSTGRPVAPSRPEEIDPSRLLLLDEGHCLADQTLAACNMRRDTGRPSLGATSLTTVSRLVASGQGITLIPEIAASVEGTGLRLQRFLDPEPGRRIGLVMRRGGENAKWVEQIETLLVQAQRSISHTSIT